MIHALRWLTAGVAVTMTLVLGMMMYFSWSPGPDVHRPAGYPLIANLFLRHSFLRLDERAGTIELDAGAPAAARAMYARTFLSSDVDDFNSGQTSTFTVENGQLVGVDRLRHNVLLPFSTIERWNGSLRYRPTYAMEASLRGVGVQIDLRGLTAPVLAERSLDEATLRGDSRPEPLSAASAEIVNLFGAPRSYLGKVHLAEDQVIVNKRTAQPEVTLSVGGQRLPRGNRAWLEPGELLKVEWSPGPRQPSRYSLLWNEGGRSADLISSPCAINGRRSRCPEGPPPFASDTLVALDAAAYDTTRRNRGADTLFDVVLTLDRRLHEDVQKALERNRRRAAVPASGEPARRAMTRAAVTVMDARNGELLALASYPTASALARVNLDPAVESRLLRNHNFSRMPVGSVAKVPLSAAIIDADPRLASLVLRQRPGAIESVAGIRVVPSIESHAVGSGGDLDFKGFIEYSSNEYAALLLTLASATIAGQPLPTFTGPLLPAEGRYSIGGRWFDRAPSPSGPRETRLNLQPDARGGVVAGTLSNLEGEPWAASFTKLFDVATRARTPLEARDPAAGDELVDTALWRPVLERCYASEVPADHPLRAVGLERDNLALNLASRYRSDLLSLMYGGAAARFTNPRLGEMFSRLVTGQKVSATLVFGLANDGEDPAVPSYKFDGIEFERGLRVQLLDAMAQVAQGGTASALRPSLLAIDRSLAAKGKALGFFSKTGSPRNLIPAPSGLAQAVNELIRVGAVSLDQDDVLTYRGERVLDEEESGPPPAAYRSLTGHGADLAIMRRHRVSPRSVYAALLLYNIEPPERRELYFSFENGRIFSMKGAKELPATGGVYVFTMGIYDSSARRSQRPLDIDAVAHEPEHAWTVAVSIEGQGNSVRVSVPFARTLIESVLWPAMAEKLQ